MSHKKNRQVLVWILLAIVVIALTSRASSMRSMTFIPPGYRVYQLAWQLQYQDLDEKDWNRWETDLRNQINEKLGAQLDDNGNKVTICQGPEIRWGNISWYNKVPLNPILYGSFDVNVQVWFYGYFPNGISEVQSHSSFDLIPRAYALTWAMAFVLMSIIAAVTILIIVTLINTIWYRVSEDLKWGKIWDDPNIPFWFKALYTIIQSILGFINTLGPMWVAVIVAIVLVVFFTSGGPRRR